MLNITANKQYLTLLKTISALSNIFSDSATPFLYYRAMENIFCASFNAANLARADGAYDAKINLPDIGSLGVGLKTFVCEKSSTIQKIAEFNHAAQSLPKTPQDLAIKLANLRNERIQMANELYGIQNAIYHCIARRTNELLLFETSYEKINIEKICDIKNANASLSFNDGLGEYFFNYSKSVLQKRFCLPPNPIRLDITILDNPLEILLSIQNGIIKEGFKPKIAGRDYVVLPLYSTKDSHKIVPEKSGLNQWNALGRKRSYGEVYIPVPRFIHEYYPQFFPPRDRVFALKTPLGESLNAKICQDGGKALMSNPNTALAKWLLHAALRLKEGELATYEQMQNLGFDSVVIFKNNDIFSIDIRGLGSYEKFRFALSG